MERIVVIGLGGAVGSILRYVVAGWVQRDWGVFPIGTLAVNVLGCVAIGFFGERLVAGSLHPLLRPALLIGVLGGFTTFSTFSWETLQLLETRQSGLAVVNIVGSVGTCLAGTWLGMCLARGMSMS